MILVARIDLDKTASVHGMTILFYILILQIYNNTITTILFLIHIDKNTISRFHVGVLTDFKDQYNKNFRNEAHFLLLLELVLPEL